MKNVVFIPNVDLNNGRSTPYHYSIKSWKAWCDVNDAELIEYILVNGETVRTNCNPGGPKIGGGKKTYCCSDRPVDILLTDLLTHFFFFYIKCSSTFFVQ